LRIVTGDDAILSITEAQLQELKKCAVCPDEVDSDSLLKIATLLEIETAGHKRRKRDGPRLLAEQENTTKPLHKLNADVMKKLKLGTKGRIAEKWRVLVNYVSNASSNMWSL